MQINAKASIAHMQPAWRTPERGAPKQAATILGVTFTAYRRTY